MLLIPQGLDTKTRRLPLATVIIAVTTGFFSFIHFKDINEGNQVFWNHPTRIEYANQARIYLQKKCNAEQAATFCVDLQKVDINDFLLPKTLDFLMSQGPRASSLTNIIGYMGEELAPIQIQKNSPPLFALQQKAEQVKQDFAKSKDLLAKQNITSLAAIKGLFIHVNFFHLVATLIILFFVSVPVEERMGGLFFLITYLSTGLLGLVAQTFLDPLNFYVVGSTAAVCGVAGALMVMFWQRQAKLTLNFFFVKSTSIYLPVSLYAPAFLLVCLAVNFFLPFHNLSYIAHFAGFSMGGLMAFAYKKLRPLPEYFTYPYELDFNKRAQANLSQTDRVQVFAEWLYYAPTNLYAFRELAKEVKRSSTNPKVNKILNRFRQYAFPEVYQLNKRNVDFLSQLPVRWLSWVAVGHNTHYLRKHAERFAEQRNFECAFKLYFLAMNEVGWKDDGDEAIELFKNFKKATTSEHFIQESNVLKDRHTPFQRFITKRNGFAVA